MKRELNTNTKMENNLHPPTEKNFDEHRKFQFAPEPEMDEATDKLWSDEMAKFLKNNKIFQDSPRSRKAPDQEHFDQCGNLPAELVALSDEEKSELLSKDFSDTENARRFLKFNKDRFLYAEDLQRWLHYNPLRPGWGDGEMAVRSRMKETANLVNQLVLSLPFTDDKKRLEKLKQCIAWKDAGGIENSIKMLRDEVFTQSNKFDTNAFLFLCKSGPINLRTGRLEDSKPSDYLRKMSPVRFDPDAKCPQWVQFLTEIFLNIPDLIFFIQKFCGYTLTGNTSEEKFLILEGPGANGKSTLLEVIAGILGEYGVPIPFATFKDPKWDQGGNAHQADIIQLIGARFIRSVEVKERARLNIERLKSLTGNDEMSARPPYARDSVHFYPVGKIWLAVNHLPKIHDTTVSCWRRLLRVPFSYIVPPDKQVKDFSKKLLQEENSGILNWMLDGCYLWQKEGLEPIPSIIMDATNEYRLESTPVKRFVSERCEVGKYQVTCSQLYEAFVDWWKDEMGEIEPISKIEMGKELKRMEMDTRPIRNVKHYVGLRLKNED
jgi:putative DNA primase/helicase